MKKLRSALGLLFVLAVCAIVARFDQPPTPVRQLDLGKLSVDGIRMGMSEKEVLAARGIPISKEPTKDGLICWNYSGSDFILLAPTRAGIVAVYAKGSRLELGREIIVRAGMTEDEVGSALAGFGPPSRMDMEYCGFSGSPFDIFFESKFDGWLYYDNGIRVSVGNRGVDEVCLSDPRSQGMR